MNDGKDVCIFCHNRIENLGSKNKSFRYPKNEKYFKVIDSEVKAYILGLIAGDGSLENTGKRVTLYANKDDIESLELFKNEVSPFSPIKDDNGCFYLRIDSIEIVRDICRHLSINPGSKHDILSLPNIDNIWHFIRGLIDSDGSISDPYKGCTTPKCKLTSNSKLLLTQIKDLCYSCDINSSLGKNNLFFVGKHAIKFMNIIYLQSIYKLNRKFQRYSIWNTWIPHYGTCVRPRKNSTFAFNKHISNSL